MPNVLIRDVPEEVHTELRRRARRDGRSLQQYLAALLTREASTRTLDDVLDRVDRLQGGHFSLAEAVETLHQARDER
jgi:plasmid stability protein